MFSSTETPLVIAQSGRVVQIVVHVPTLADASACQLAALLRELVNTRGVLATTKLPL